MKRELAEDWIQVNTGKRVANKREGWSDWFSTVCWLLWKRHNERIFAGKLMSNETLIMIADSIIYCMTNVRKRLAGSKLNGSTVQDREAKWCPPNTGWMKINIDGAFSSSNGIGCGGVLRDEDGSFHAGFMFKSREGDSLTAELWALMHGLKMGWDKGIRRLIVETDSTEVVRLVLEEDESSHPDACLIIEVRTWWQTAWRNKL